MRVFDADSAARVGIDQLKRCSIFDLTMMERHSIAFCDKARFILQAFTCWFDVQVRFESEKVFKIKVTETAVPVDGNLYVAVFGLGT